MEENTLSPSSVTEIQAIARNVSEYIERLQAIFAALKEDSVGLRTES